ncbi:hypothetical protein ACSSS7_005429 [Eimeria intestinalis]
MQEQEQEKLLEEASAVVREQGCYMKRAIDSDNLRDALKHASNFVSELRTSLLSPKHYYELYMLVFQELQHLLGFFCDKSRHGRRLADLYETVQHAGNIVPRLYLLVTVGVAFIKSKEAPAADILRDLTELCKGVQHPMRGLFLRFYLTQLCRNVLPDKGSEYEQEGGSSSEDAFLFLLANFTESARLWVRLQQQSSVRDRVKREKERQDLRVLVGSALVRMAQLEGMSVEFYKTQALPAILQQVFSDECHLQTLDLLLAETANVQKGVALKPVLVNLLNRLTSFLQANPEALPQDISVFDLFRAFLESQITATILAYSAGGGSPCAMDLPSLVALEVAFLNFCLSLFPSRIDYVSQVLDGIYRLLASTCQRISTAAPAAAGRSPPSSAKLRGAGLVDLSPTAMPGVVAASASARTDTSNMNLKPLPEAGMEALMDLLSAPLRVLSLEVLSIDSYAPLMDFLDLPTRNLVASSMVSAVLAAGTPLSSAESLGRFLTLISPLLRDEAPVKRLDDESEAVEENETVTRQLQQVAMLIHLANAADTDDHFNLLLVAKSKFAEGGQRRLRVLLPPLAVSACRLLLAVLNRQQRAEQRDPDVTAPANGGKKVCQFLHSTCLELVQIDPQVALRLWLMAAMAADNAHVMVGGYDAICHEFLSQALVCFEEEITESKRQFAALTEASTSHVSLFIEILDKYVYYFDQNNPEHLKWKKEADGGAKYRGLDLSVATT